MLLVNVCMYSFFFFSSRRRHTRCSRDWSSDVCSSDLEDREKAAKLRLSSGLWKVASNEDKFAGTSTGISLHSALFHLLVIVGVRVSHRRELQLWATPLQ